MPEMPEERIAEQEAELRAFADLRAKRIIDRIDQARRDILAEILDLSAQPDSEAQRRRLNSVLQQMDAIQKNMVDDIRLVGSSDQYIGKLVEAHVSEAVSFVASVPMSVGFDTINTRAISLFAQNELEKVTRLAENQLDVIRGALVRDVGAKGLNPRTVAYNLAKSDSGLFAGMYARLQTIIRTESATVYNAQTMEGLRYAVKERNIPLRVKISEHKDDARNHPISQVIDRQVQEVGDSFRAKVSAVEAVAKRLAAHSGKKKRKATTAGIFWPRVGEYYVGGNLPAHYNERGRIVPTQLPVTPES